ncbi:extracellular solute-binding protein [Demequina litorisediminis]|uniref:Extracellular solute-binding protein n=1 Tax=Demequina litorisediminis TaxID=1849022 RepID=A0ABQ6IEZ9_9MICO|nr:extracellular solute-binding protein [Demequina litorisediminis]GMA36021.1 hypothetical protein GCM10025876_22250 [Demequina litorisediminis]
MDVTAEVDALGYSDKFNPIILDGVTDAEGNIFGFPRQAYAMGLHYNRDLFEEAGLDPDNPPATWDEVREAAKAISDKTGKAGYSQMAINNTGGWQAHRTDRVAWRPHPGRQRRRHLHVEHQQRRHQGHP